MSHCHSQCPASRCLVAERRHQQDVREAAEGKRRATPKTPKVKPDPGVAPLLDGSWGGRSPGLVARALAARQNDVREAVRATAPAEPERAPRTVQRPGEPHDSGDRSLDPQTQQLVSLAAHRRHCHTNHHASCRGFLWVVYDDRTGLPKLATYADGSLKGKRVGGQILPVPETVFIRCQPDEKGWYPKCQDCQKEQSAHSEKQSRKIDSHADVWLFNHGAKLESYRK